ncbi:MAG: MOSC domain-containing protein [Deltaproteobacteria bacterium]|nr:MOSC domain-containing protein [Deltaproteobacteria bacterium]
MIVGDALRAWLAEPRSSRLERIVCRLGEGRHRCPRSARLTRAEGLVGDRWSADPRPAPDRQLTLMDARVVRRLLAHAAARPGAPAPELALGEPHEALDRPGDNLVIDLPTGLATLPPGTRLRIGSAVVETNDTPHAGCKKFEARFGADALAWVNDRAHADLKLRGLNAIVVEDGEVHEGDLVVVLP